LNFRTGFSAEPKLWLPSGQSFNEFLTEALRDKLLLHVDHARSDEPEWMRGFGKLKRLHKETVRVQSVIDQECEVVEPEDRR